MIFLLSCSLTAELDGMMDTEVQGLVGSNTCPHLLSGSRSFWFPLSWNLFCADILVPDWPQLCQWQVHVFFLGIRRWSLKRPHSLLNSGFKKFRLKSMSSWWPVLLCHALSCMLLHVQIQNNAFVLGIRVICNL